MSCARENIPLATSIYLFVSGLVLCNIVILSLLSVIKMILPPPFEAGRQLHFLTHVSES
jgi:hypothetical protein